MITECNVIWNKAFRRLKLITNGRDRVTNNFHPKRVGLEDGLKEDKQDAYVRHRIRQSKECGPEK